MRGAFITFEGIDGAGNTTHSRLAADWFRTKGFDVILTKEPTKHGDIGKLIRKYLKNEEIHPAVDALLFAADRVEHTYSVILPAISEGKVVVSDRYVESSMAYQCAQGLDQKWVYTINKYAIKPDLTIILDIEPESALKRKKVSEKFEKLEFLRKVRWNLIKRAMSENYVIIYTGMPVNEVHNEIIKILKVFVKKHFHIDI